jgi:hypothetical protein
MAPAQPAAAARPLDFLNDQTLRTPMSIRLLWQFYRASGNNFSAAWREWRWRHALNSKSGAYCISGCICNRAAASNLIFQAAPLVHYFFHDFVAQLSRPFKRSPMSGVCLASRRSLILCPG